jgi:hypothetical protein
MRIDQQLAPLAKALFCIELDISMCLLQVVDISLLMRLPLLFENLDVLMGFPFVLTEQQKIGFPMTLGIRDNNVWRDDGFHGYPPVLLRYGRLCIFDAVLGWG